MIYGVFEHSEVRGGMFLCVVEALLVIDISFRCCCLIGLALMMITWKWNLLSFLDLNNLFFANNNENIEANISSSNLGFFNYTKKSTKSEEKNTKMNLQNLMESDVRVIKRNYPGIILSNKINIENNENKLDLLIKILEDYREIIMERIFCKNFTSFEQPQK